jgi:hypothetical protein
MCELKPGGRLVRTGSGGSTRGLVGMDGHRNHNTRLRYFGIILTAFETVRLFKNSVRC